MTRARVLADYVAGGSTAAEFDVLDGLTSTTAELNILDGVTSTAAELNILDGVTSTAAELNHVDGVTSNVQTQLNAKAPLASPTFTGNFTSVGIDDNADATAITIKSDETVGIRNTDPTPLNGVGIHIGDGSTSTASLAIEDDEKQWDVYVNGGMVLRNTTASRNMLSLAEESGDVTVNTGDLIFETAGKGVVLGATTNVDANTLDDYEEGNWTPTIGASGETVNKAKYIKIGSQVTIAFDLTITNGSGGSTTTLSGLPFANPSDNISYPVSISYHNTLAVNIIYLVGSIGNNGSIVTFNGNATSTAHMSASLALFGTNARVIGAGTYFINT